MSDEDEPAARGRGGQPPPDRRVVTDHDRRRLRVSRRVALAGPVLGLVAIALLVPLGVGGAGGLAVLLVSTAAGCVVAAFVTAVHAIVDEYRYVPVARRRTLTALGLFAASFVLVLLSAGVAATV